MTPSHWALIAILAIAAFTIRVIGLYAGDQIRTSRYVWVLDELPGLIIVSLIGASLAGENMQTWLAALLALAAAIMTNHVIATMCLGVAAFSAFNWLIG